MESVLERFRPTHVFDWGTNVGASARLFYEASLEHGYECEVHTVELPLELAHLDRDHPGHRYGQWIKETPIHAHQGFGLQVSIRLCAELKPARPLFFLDGNHSFEAVFEELTVISDEEPGAVLMVHDTNNLTGTAIKAFLNNALYRREDCTFDSGVAALWPSG